MTSPGCSDTLLILNGFRRSTCQPKIWARFSWATQSKTHSTMSGQSATEMDWRHEAKDFEKRVMCVCTAMCAGWKPTSPVHFCAIGHWVTRICKVCHQLLAVSEPVNGQGQDYLQENDWPRVSGRPKNLHYCNLKLLKWICSTPFSSGAGELAGGQLTCCADLRFLLGRTLAVDVCLLHSAWAARPGSMDPMRFMWFVQRLWSIRRPGRVPCRAPVEGLNLVPVSLKLLRYTNGFPVGLKIDGRWRMVWEWQLLSCNPRARLDCFLLNCDPLTVTMCTITSRLGPDLRQSVARKFWLNIWNGDHKVKTQHPRAFLGLNLRLYYHANEAEFEGSRVVGFEAAQDSGQRWNT